MRKLLLMSLITFLLVGAAGCALRPAASSPTTTAATSISSVPIPGSTSTAASSATSTSASSTTTSLESHAADLSGQEEVPAVTTSAIGFVSLTVEPQRRGLSYVVLVDRITGVTIAKLHESKAGATGKAIAILYAGPTKRASFSGVLAQGSLGTSDLVGPLKGKSLSDLLGLMRVGQIYVNIGTTKHPNGEIRGQLH